MPAVPWRNSKPRPVPKAGNDRLTEIDPSTGVDNPSIPKAMWVNLPDDYINTTNKGD